WTPPLCTTTICPRRPTRTASALAAAACNREKRASWRPRGGRVRKYDYVAHRKKRTQPGPGDPGRAVADGWWSVGGFRGAAGCDPGPVGCADDHLYRVARAEPYADRGPDHVPDRHLPARGPRS